MDVYLDEEGISIWTYKRNKQKKQNDNKNTIGYRL